MVTDKAVREALNVLTNDMSAYSEHQHESLLTLVRYCKHQMIRKQREANGLGHLNREEDAIERIGDLGLNIPSFTKH